MSLEEIFHHAANVVDLRKPAVQPFKWIPTNHRKLECLLGLKDDSINIGRVKSKGRLSDKEIELKRHQGAACHHVYKFVRNDIVK